MTNLQFDLLEFKPLRSFAAWRRRYRGVIRVSIDWTALASMRLRPKLHLCDPWDVRVPWYRGGDWRTGRPRRPKPGDALALARVPGVVVRSVKPTPPILLLDGTHRILEVRPRIVLVDLLEVSKAQARVFTDFHNDAYRPWASHAS